MIYDGALLKMRKPTNVENGLLPFNKTVHELFHLNSKQTIIFSRIVSIYIYIKRKQKSLVKLIYMAIVRLFEITF